MMTKAGMEQAIKITDIIEQAVAMRSMVLNIDYMNCYLAGICTSYQSLTIRAGECCIKDESSMYQLGEGADIGLSVMSNTMSKLGNMHAAYGLLAENDTFFTIKHAEEQIRYGNIEKEEVTPITLKELSSIKNIKVFKA